MNTPQTPGLYLNTSTTMTTPSAQALQAALGAGFVGIEIRMERLGPHPQEAAEVTALGGEVLSVNGLQIQIDASGRVDQPRLESELAERLALCRSLPSPYLLIVPPLTEGLSQAAALPGLRKALSFCKAEAAKIGAKVAFEFLGFPTCPFNTLASAVTAVDGLGIELVIDSCHWYASGAPALSAQVVHNLAIVHLNDVPSMAPASIQDADRVLPGEGVLPLRDFIGQLRTLGYAGPWSVETFNPAYWTQPPAEVARRAYAAGQAALSVDAAVPGA
ncbi:sugar phosphate isomerase/epimerase family protein [Deinococcus sp.]|uniref:sugar phosphate isomerase/epimerase family protein n=1 Tax=Deinococcus sp. TaxID=47478 RepID=UPI003CC67738